MSSVIQFVYNEDGKTTGHIIICNDCIGGAEYMNTDELKRRFINGCWAVIDIRDELSEFDAEYGHTMEKIADTLANAMNGCDGTVADIMGEAADAISGLKGGSAVHMWGGWFSGMADAAADKFDINADQLKKMFSAGLKELNSLPGKSERDQTMADILSIAAKAMDEADSEEGLFEKAYASVKDTVLDVNTYPAVSFLQGMAEPENS